jgi:hypothetical protein
MPITADIPQANALRSLLASRCNTRSPSWSPMLALAILSQLTGQGTVALAYGSVLE